MCCAKYQDVLCKMKSRSVTHVLRNKYIGAGHRSGGVGLRRQSDSTVRPGYSKACEKAGGAHEPCDGYVLHPGREAVGDVIDGSHRSVS